MANLTLEDIGRKAGVSRSTVSRVINDMPNVRAVVRERVLQVIAETGYQPHAAARSLASRRTGVIGLVIPRSVNALCIEPHFPRLTQGIAQACNQLNYTFSLFLLRTREEEQQLYPRITRGGLVDGVIIQATCTDDERIHQLLNSGIPCVVLGRPCGVPNASYVDVDYVAGAYNAVAHLIRRGYRRIGTITCPLNTTIGRDRYAGYRKACAERGLEVQECLVVEGDFTPTGGFFAAQPLLRQEPDAVFVGSDMMALGALRAIHEADLVVPDDIALVGFDDLPPAAMTLPPLTTVRQPVRAVGIKLVETLLDIIEYGDRPPRRVVFETELVIRASCGSRLYGSTRRL